MIDYSVTVTVDSVTVLCVSSALKMDGAEAENCMQLGVGIAFVTSGQWNVSMKGKTNNVVNSKLQRGNYI